MKSGKEGDIVERSVAYSLRIISVYRELEKDSAGRILGIRYCALERRLVPMSTKLRVRRARRILSPRCPLLTKKPLKPPAGYG